MDEYNTKSLTKKEVSTIVKLFLEKEPFKMSKILLALQPIEIKRKDFHYIKVKKLSIAKMEICLLN